MLYMNAHSSFHSRENYYYCDTNLKIIASLHLIKTPLYDNLLHLTPFNLIMHALRMHSIHTGMHTKQRKMQFVFN